MKQTWSIAELERLQAAYENRPAGQGCTQFAAEYAKRSSRTADSVQSALRQPLSPSRHAVRNVPMVIEGDALVLGDMHVPVHNAEFIDLAIDRAKREGITSVLLGGDACDMQSFSHWGEDFSDGQPVMDKVIEDKLLKIAQTLKGQARQEIIDMVSSTVHGDSIGGEIHETREIFRQINDNFKDVYWMMGNHEKWVVKTLEKALPASELKVIFGQEGWNVTSQYWAVIKSGGVEWLVEHPINLAKGSSKKLVSKFLQNVIMLHNHHLSVVSDPSGRYLAIEPGMCCDETRMAYVQQRHNTADRHINGAVIIKAGKPILINSLMI